LISSAAQTADQRLDALLLELIEIFAAAGAVPTANSSLNSQVMRILLICLLSSRRNKVTH